MPLRLLVAGEGVRNGVADPLHVDRDETHPVALAPQQNPASQTGQREVFGAPSFATVVLLSICTQTALPLSLSWNDLSTGSNSRKLIWRSLSVSDRTGRPQTARAGECSTSILDRIIPAEG